MIMNREIKFRIWNINDRKYWNNSNGVSLSELSRALYGMLDDNSFVFQQFVGITDKSGKEVYDGDIVSVYDKDNLFQIKFGKVVRTVISYDKQANYPLEFNTFYFESVKDGKAYFSITENCYKQHDLEGTEVVGNIFEDSNVFNIQHK